MQAAKKFEPSTMARTCAASDIIDIETYPIHCPDSAAYKELIARCRDQAEDPGCVVIKDFIRPEALKAMRAETEKLSAHGHYNDTYTNPYNSADDESLPETHPKRMFQDRNNGFVAGDLIAQDTAIRKLYRDPALQQFIADCLGVEEVFEYADPLAGLVVNVLRPGCQHPWHFDTNEFIVTMMTKEPEAGGLFQYCPGIRSPRDENFEDVAKTVQGDHSLVNTLDVRPGDLQIFFGRYSLHRVSRVEGEAERHTVILGYAKEPNIIGRAERTQKLFGRLAEVHRKQLEEQPARADTLAD